MKPSDLDAPAIDAMPEREFLVSRVVLLPDRPGHLKDGDGYIARYGIPARDSNGKQWIIREDAAGVYKSKP